MTSNKTDVNLSVRAKRAKVTYLGELTEILRELERQDPELVSQVLDLWDGHAENAAEYVATPSRALAGKNILGSS